MFRFPCGPKAVKAPPEFVPMTAAKAAAEAKIQAESLLKERIKKNIEYINCEISNGVKWGSMGIDIDLYRVIPEVEKYFTDLGYFWRFDE